MVPGGHFVRSGLYWRRRRDGAASAGIGAVEAGAGMPPAAVWQGGEAAPMRHRVADPPERRRPRAVCRHLRFGHAQRNQAGAQQVGDVAATAGVEASSPAGCRAYDRLPGHAPGPRRGPYSQDVLPPIRRVVQHHTSGYDRPPAASSASSSSCFRLWIRCVHWAQSAVRDGGAQAAQVSALQRLRAGILMPHAHRRNCEIG